MSQQRFRFGGYQPPRSVHTRALRHFRDGVTERAGGAIEIDLTENVTTAGHQAADLLHMVAHGALHGAYFASSYLAAAVQSLNVLDLPFSAAPRPMLFAGLDGAAGARLAADVAAATPYRVLGFWDNGIRHLSNAVRAIHGPADCHGLRLRTLDNALHQAAFRCLGFAPMQIDVADLSSAVAERRVDAQENPLTNLVNFGLHAHHRHVSLSGHLQGVALLLVNRDWFDSLAGAQRDLLVATARHSTTSQRAAAAAEDAVCTTVLTDAGVVPLDEAELDIAGFRAAVAPLIATHLPTLDPMLRASLLSV